jgi:hypothetical protein
MDLACQFRQGHEKGLRSVVWSLASCCRSGRCIHRLTSAQFHLSWLVPNRFPSRRNNDLNGSEYAGGAIVRIVGEGDHRIRIGTADSGREGAFYPVAHEYL